MTTGKAGTAPIPKPAAYTTNPGAGAYDSVGPEPDDEREGALNAESKRI